MLIFVAEASWLRFASCPSCRPCFALLMAGAPAAQRVTAQVPSTQHAPTPARLARTGAAEALGRAEAPGDLIDAVLQVRERSDDDAVRYFGERLPEGLRSIDD